MSLVCGAIHVVMGITVRCLPSVTFSNKAGASSWEASHLTQACYNLADKFTIADMHKEPKSEDA